MVKAYGAKIDGVGLQAHLIEGQVPSASVLTSNLKNFVQLGVEVAYTELDIRIHLPVTSASEAQQAVDYTNVITSCKKIAKCVGVTTWGYSDNHSWIPGVFAGYGSALPFDKNLKPKLAYWAILNAWKGK